MTEVILIGFISVGVITAVQGMWVMRGRRRARPLPFEKPLLDVVSPKGEAETMRFLGRLRLTYGIFLVVVGIWGLSGL
ncbi:MAG: hypothetical protein JXC32_07175 [Anaerolineae bacterium]|nr:hypothetical protein [Anaerolineae bacterium]